MRAALIAECTLALFSAGLVNAQKSGVSPGYDHFYNLEYDEALADFRANAEQYPEDPNAWNHVAHALLYRSMYRSGALESELVTGSNPFLHRDKVKISPADDAAFYDAVNKSIRLSQARLQENPNDPVALGALGVAYGVRGNYNFLVRKAWVDALHDGTDARNAHKHLCEIEPDNVDARMIPAVYDYVVGSLPIAYRILGFIAGYHGSRIRGIEMLEKVVKEGTANRADAQILLAAIYRREHRSADAIPLLEDLAQRFPRNYLLRFEIVQMASDAGKKDEALAEIAHIWELQRSGAPGFGTLAPEKIDYLEGNLLFWYDDLDQALLHMKRATAKAHELNLHMAMMSWMRLGQICDLQGHHPAAVAAYRKAIAMAPRSGVGKESRGYIAKPYRKKGTQQPEVAAAGGSRQ